MAKFYGLITTHTDLGNLERKALEADKHAVGFTKSGKLYKYDSATRRGVLITKSEAAVILGCEEVEIDLIIETKGKYLLKSLQEAENKPFVSDYKETGVNVPVADKNATEGENEAENDEDDEDDEYEDEAYSLLEAVEDTENAVDDAVEAIKANADENTDKVIAALDKIAELIEKLVDAIVLD